MRIKTKQTENDAEGSCSHIGSVQRQNAKYRKYYRKKCGHFCCVREMRRKERRNGTHTHKGQPGMLKWPKLYSDPETRTRESVLTPQAAVKHHAQCDAAHDASDHYIFTHIFSLISTVCWFCVWLNASVFVVCHCIFILFIYLCLRVRLICMFPCVSVCRLVGTCGHKYIHKWINALLRVCISISARTLVRLCESLFFWLSVTRRG